MSRVRTVLSRGVSPYVSTIILTLIVLGVGSYLLVSALSRFQAETQNLRREAQRLEYEARQALSVVASFINGTELAIYVATGDWPTKILGIYVNDTLFMDRCSCTIVGSDEVSWSVPPYALAYISCDLSTISSSPTFVDVKIVYEGGEVVTHASRI